MGMAFVCGPQLYLRIAINSKKGVLFAARRFGERICPDRVFLAYGLRRWIDLDEGIEFIGWSDQIFPTRVTAFI
jgi:hypothetical protein